MAIAARDIERDQRARPPLARRGDTPLARRSDVTPRRASARSIAPARESSPNAPEAREVVEPAERPTPRRLPSTIRTTSAGGGRVLVRTTVALEPQEQPRLHVVPKRRRNARWAGVVLGAVVVTMAVAAAFQTQLARRQVEMDRLDSEIHAAREQYEILRRERAQLRSPSRLSEIASDIGMVPATETGFMVMTPEVLAIVQQSVGTLAADDIGESPDPLAVFRDVKAVTDGAP